MKPMWAMLLHLGYNEWHDRYSAFCGKDEDQIFRDFLYFDEKAWHEILAFLPSQGIDTLLIDIAEGVCLESHPELAVKGSWSKQKLAEEIGHLRAKGFCVLPKLDFSAAHDAWLGEYHQTVGSLLYERVVKEIIDEVCELFDNPPYFHLGMGDEYADAQKYYGHCIIRNVNIFWREMYQMWDALSAHGVRPWISSEYYQRYPKAFLAKLSPEVLLSVEYSSRLYPEDPMGIRSISSEQKLFKELCRSGYDFIPEVTVHGIRQTANDVFWYADRNFRGNERFKGIMAVSDMATVETAQYGIMHIAQRFGAAKHEHWDK